MTSRDNSFAVTGTFDVRCADSRFSLGCERANQDRVCDGRQRAQVGTNCQDEAICGMRKKRTRQYEHIKDSAKSPDDTGPRSVKWRATVMKEHKNRGHIVKANSGMQSPPLPRFRVDTGVLRERDARDALRRAFP